MARLTVQKGSFALEERKSVEDSIIVVRYRYMKGISRDDNAAAA
jgi:hypothetical protein